MTAGFENEDIIYDGARRLADPAARAAWLDEACAGNAALRERVEALLRAEADADNFFDRRAVDLNRLPALSADDVAPSSLLPEQPGEKIGRYKLLQQIGEGGFGAVWMAEQTEPVTRRVALKIIKPGMDTREVIARFEAERQALAMMDHPNIAQVFDAGATDKGRPFFVMELVKGVPVTTWCDEAQAGTRERLAIFGDVCSAIQHAHQKGIIHRDIKPSNVMVTMHGEKPVVKVIDFGIAKATEARLTDKTLFTRYEQFVGTPVYMSPEQASKSGLDIDTRADIYALGILLYELLTGKPPFDAKSLVSAGYEEMRRIIREVEPPKPSSRLRTAAGEERTTLAKARQIAPEKLSHLVEPDLDWIVMKAIEKDRNRRYGTASGLAQDIQRFLADEPVSARPPSAGYRFRKWVRRNRVTFATSSAVALSLVIGLSLSTWLFFKESAARRDADEAGLRFQRQLYCADMNLAKQAWDEAHVSRVLELLRLHLPQPGEPDFRGFEWYYLERLCRSDLLTLKSSTGPFSCLAFSPDGSLLAAAGHGHAVTIREAATGQATLTLEEVAGAAHSVAFSADGKFLAAAGSDGHANGEVRVWDMNGRRVLSLNAFPGPVGCVAFCPDGKRLATTSLNAAEVWDVATGQKLLTLKGHMDWVNGITFSPDGNRLATASRDGSVNLWNAATGKLVTTLLGHRNQVWTVAFSPDGEQLVSASDDNSVKVWDTPSGIGRIALHLLRNPAGWFRKTDQEVLALRGRNKHFFSAKFSRDGSRLITASDDQTVTIWDAVTGTEILVLKGHTDEVISASLSPDGRLAASAGRDGLVKVWNAAASQETLVMKYDRWRGYGLAFHPDGNEVASAQWDGTLTAWRVSSGEVARTFPATVPHGDGDYGWIEAVAYSPDGKWLASGCDNEPLKIRNAMSGEVAVELKGHTGKVRCVAFNPAGTILASSGNDHTIRIWNASDGREMHTLRGHTANVLKVAFRFDGKRLASASAKGDQTIRIWDPATDRELLALRGHQEGVTSVAWSPDGRQLASSSFDGTVRLWDALSGQNILILSGHSGGVMTVAFSPDGRRLASGGYDGMVKFWDVANGQETLTLKAHGDRVGTVAFSPDGTRLASAGSDTIVKVWDSRDRRTDGLDPAMSSAAFWKAYDQSKTAPVTASK